MFKNKIVLITGGSSGIGMATALLFAHKGADVVITYKNNKKGALRVVNDIKKLGRKSLAIQADLVKDEDAKKVIQSVIDNFGKIDVLVNNAGRYIDGDEWNLNSKTWLKSLQQNLVSVMSMSKYVTELFEKQKSGIIVNVASKHGVFGHADSISYGAAKAGIINVTQSYSKLLSSFGGRANSVSPGAVMTGYWLTAPKKELEEKLAEKSDRGLLDPQEIAKKIVFLASDDAGNINGQNFLIE
jgi:3-oxoacyl-[acyl-carrier protein] reductase